MMTSAQGRSQQQVPSAILNQVVMVQQGDFGILTDQIPNNENLQQILVQALDQNISTGIIPDNVDMNVDDAKDRLLLWQLAGVGSLNGKPEKDKPIEIKSAKLLRNHSIKLSNDKQLLERHPSSGMNNTGNQSKDLRRVVVDQRVQESLHISEHSSESEKSQISSFSQNFSDEAQLNLQVADRDDQSQYSSLISEQDGSDIEGASIDQLQDLLNHEERKSSSNNSISFESEDNNSLKYQNSDYKYDFPNLQSTQEESQVCIEMEQHRSHSFHKKIFTASKGKTLRYDV